ncbi:hypothetical protein LEP1GSC024_2641 [Leptospira noguchii str. 2001034031]|uniref:Uncharacterized protein n=1 Tax=Leptospira noguchii str. 2001034031 TaxID=1193053 RepID=M6YPK8_9LEPT|nr:hypothetical protein LEP1GSC024_2641 [Leptospira noguchii str. 2001034031]
MKNKTNSFSKRKITFVYRIEYIIFCIQTSFYDTDLLYSIP